MGEGGNYFLFGFYISQNLSISFSLGTDKVFDSAALVMSPVCIIFKLVYKWVKVSLVGRVNFPGSISHFRAHWIAGYICLLAFPFNVVLVSYQLVHCKDLYYIIIFPFSCECI